MKATVGKRIQSCIDHMDKGEIELALSELCIAIDITSQKYFNTRKSSASVYKKFLKENMWIIMMTGTGNLICPIKVKFSHPDIKSVDDFCNLEDIIYHVVRCELIHNTGENSNIEWGQSSYPILSGPKGELLLSTSFIWGVILAVISSPVNKDEKVNELCWISSLSFKYFINDLWGRIDIVKRIAELHFGKSFLTNI